MKTGLLIAAAVGGAALVAAIGAGPREVTAPRQARVKDPSPGASVPSVAPSRTRARDAFVGSGACAACHREQREQYLRSHHAKALVVPTPELAERRFDGGRFTSKLGGTTHFGLRDGEPVVTTPMPGGKTASLPIAYVSGVWPLEQYVVAAERGKLQSLGVVWDSREADHGGGRWLHVYGPDGIAPTDPLFFTSPAQNFNHMCADCHSTGVERRYDVDADRFDTRWAELSVGCEACHGPGAEHVRSAAAGNIPAPFAVPLEPSAPWQPSVTGSPTPRRQDGVEVEVCAPCHSRREPLEEGFVASDPFLDSFEPELLLPGRYHADGQLEGEVYEWASFLQSRMYQAGVRCSDCHNPHSGKPHATGDALCVRCHEPARFAVPAHSRHSGATAPRCVDCHMPPATFMQVDERRDHSLRIPRPDHSVEFGTPNACTTCHTDKSATWARDRVATWFPALPQRPHFVEALARDRQGALLAPGLLRRLADDVAAPAIARATALERLGSYPANDKTLRTLRSGLASGEPLLVYGAVRGAAQLPEQQRAPLLSAVLRHRLRAVRIAAAKALAGLRSAELSAGTRAAIERAFVEVEQSYAVSASRAETHVERSAFELARGKFEDAERSLRTALKLEPCLAEAQLNLAELRRQRGDEAGAEQAIRAALACSPRNAAAHHALGLWQVRTGKPGAALASLRRAVDLAPNDPRFGYVLALAMGGRGDRNGAIGLLQTILQNRPSDAAALRALAGYLGEAGQLEPAAEARQKLDALLSE